MELGGRSADRRWYPRRTLLLVRTCVWSDVVFHGHTIRSSSARRLFRLLSQTERSFSVGSQFCLQSRCYYDRPSGSDTLLCLLQTVRCSLDFFRICVAFMLDVRTCFSDVAANYKYVSHLEFAGEKPRAVRLSDIAVQEHQAASGATNATGRRFSRSTDPRPMRAIGEHSPMVPPRAAAPRSLPRISLPSDKPAGAPRRSSAGVQHSRPALVNVCAPPDGAHHAPSPNRPFSLEHAAQGNSTSLDGHQNQLPRARTPQPVRGAFRRLAEAPPVGRGRHDRPPSRGPPPTSPLEYESHVVQVPLQQVPVPASAEPMAQSVRSNARRSPSPGFSRPARSSLPRSHSPANPGPPRAGHHDRDRAHPVKSSTAHQHPAPGFGRPNVVARPMRDGRGPPLADPRPRHTPQSSRSYAPNHEDPISHPPVSHSDHVGDNSPSQEHRSETNSNTQVTYGKFPWQQKTPSVAPGSDVRSDHPTGVGTSSMNTRRAPSGHRGSLKVATHPSMFSGSSSTHNTPRRISVPNNVAPVSPDTRAFQHAQDGHARSGGLRVADQRPHRGAAGAHGGRPPPLMVRSPPLGSRMAGAPAAPPAGGFALKGAMS